MKEKYTILYVDDEEANLRIFRNTFRRDFNIIIVSSAKEGLKVLEENCIDLVITDQRMPEMTGVEFLREITERFNDIPPNRLILSGYAKTEDIEEAFLKYKLTKFVSKPWNSEELKTIILNTISENL